MRFRKNAPNHAFRVMFDHTIFDFVKIVVIAPDGNLCRLRGYSSHRVGEKLPTIFF